MSHERLPVLRRRDHLGARSLHNPQSTGDCYMTMPTREDFPQTGSFWMTVIGVWLVMLIVGFTLAIALGIWNLVEAF